LSIFELTGIHSGYSSYPSFVTRRPLLPEILGQTDPLGAALPILDRSTSAINLAKKVQLTLIGSPLRAFQ